MSPNHIKDLLRKYERNLYSYKAKAYDEEDIAPAKDEALSHAKWMIEALLYSPSYKHVWGEATTQKAMRWLTFIQGALFCYGHYNLKQLRNHNRGNYEPRS